MASHATQPAVRTGTGGDARRPAALWLPALFLLAFSFGTDDMVIAGILPDIARDLAVSVPLSGQLVTVFAVAYALGAPPAALLTARLPRRTVLVAAAGVFVVANLAAAAAPAYGALLAARAVAGLAAATASPVAFAVAAAAAPEGRQGRYLAVVGAGLTTSLVAGVPVGAWLGEALGWRATMLFVAALAAVAGTALAVTLPPLPGGAAGGLRDRLAPLGRRRTLIGLTAMVPAGAGGMMPYVYLTEVAGRLGEVRGAGVAPLITVVGAAGVAGSLAGGRAVDALGARRALLLFASGMLAAPALMLAFALAGGPYPRPVVAVLYLLYGLAAWGIGPAVQAWLIERDGGAAAGELIALNNSAMFLGFSLAGGIGGLALQAGGAAAVPAAAAGCLIVSLALFGTAFTGSRRKEE